MNIYPHAHLTTEERAALRGERRLIVYQGHQHAVFCDGTRHFARSWAWEGEVDKGACWCQDLGGPGWDGTL